LIVNDNLKLKQAIEESRILLDSSRNTFQKQLEQMETEELTLQKRLGNEMMHTEEQLTQVRKENDLLRIEYEQNVAANEQTGPINKEMRSLITTLQTKNKLLNSDNLRTKKRCEELQIEIERFRKQNNQLQSQLQSLINKKDQNFDTTAKSEQNQIENKVKNSNFVKKSLNSDIRLLLFTSFKFLPFSLNFDL